MKEQQSYFYLNEEKFNKLFPYYILIDVKFNVVAIGEGLINQFPESINKPFLQNYIIQSPKLLDVNFDCLQKLSNELIVIECQNSQRTILHGSIEYQSKTNQLLFIGLLYKSIEEKDKINNPSLIDDNSKILFQKGEIHFENCETTNKHSLQFLDATDNIKSEKNLSESIKELQAITENVPGILYQYAYHKDGSEEFIYIGPRVQEKIGITENNLRNFYEILSPEDRELQKQITLQSIVDSKSYRFEGRFILEAKPDIWLSMASSYSHTTLDGSIIHTGIIQNITKEKKAEKAIKIREEKYRSIISNMNLGLLEVDLDEKILYANQSFINLSGYSQQELLAKNANELFVPTESSMLISEKKEFRKNNISDAYELKVKNKQGEYKWWLISGAPSYNDKGELIGSIGIHLDITQQKRLEIELIAAREQAEGLAKIKENFLANMSHEIRTPMNAIMGMSNQLSKSPLSNQQKFYVDIINSAADNLMVIINDILDISKIEAGKLAIEKIGFEPKVVVSNAMQVMMHKTEAKGLSFTNSYCDEALSSVLLGDPFRINQVMLNLISNAIKFTEKGGVDITCEVINDTATHQTIKVSVKDTGIGMEESFVDNLFNKFSQEYESITRKYGGTGLGMSISKQLVELMGGKIYVESKKGKGTIVSFEIEFAKGIIENLPIKETLQLDAAAFEGRKILITDDNDLNRLVASAVLKNYGAQIIEATNGNEAIAAIQQNEVDVVLMDIQMPDINGLEATRIIRSKGYTMPVIALTANAIKGESDKCISAGMDDYISKPFKEDEFLKIIGRWLDKKIVIQKNEQLTMENNKITLYNLSNLKSISRDNEEFVQKMVALFCEQTPDMVKEMTTSFVSNNLEKMGAIAHKMKPSIDNLEIISLKETIRMIEKYGKEKNNAPELKNLIKEVDEILHKVIEEMKKNKN